MLRCKLLCALVTLAIAAAAQTVPFPPVISTLSPTSGPSAGGYVATISGSSFGTTAGAVVFDGGLVTPSTWTSNSVSFVVPPGQGANRHVRLLLANGLISNVLQFNYFAPQITAMSNSQATPAPGEVFQGSTNGGEDIYIHGQNLGTNPNVSINGMPAQVTGVSQGHDWVRVLSPPGQGTAIPVFVVAGNQLSNVSTGLFYLAPNILDVSHRIFEPAGGEYFVIYGQNFGISGAAVTIGSVPQIVVSQDHTSITCMTAPGSGINLTLTLSVAGQSDTLPFHFSFGYPEIDGIEPSWASVTGGTTFKIKGQFLSGNYVNVAVGGVPATLTSWFANEITCVAPPGGGYLVDVAVSTDTFSWTLDRAMSYAYLPNTNGARHFDGVDDVIVVPGILDSELVTADSGVIQMWFKYDGTQPAGSEPTLFEVAHGVAANTSAMRLFLDNGHLTFQWGSESITSSTFVADNQSHFVSVYFSTYGCWSISVDGEEFECAGGSIPSALFGSSVLSIGHRLDGTLAPSSSAFAWCGTIDEFRILEDNYFDELSYKVAMTSTLPRNDPNVRYTFHFDTGMGQDDNVGISGAATAAIFGTQPTADPSDPTLVPGIAVPFLVPQTGQSNSQEANLVVNNVGYGNSAGPYRTFVTSDAYLSFEWSGPDFAPLLLIAGPRNPGGAMPACLGTLDVGHAPLFNDIIILVDGTQPTFPNSLFRLNGYGNAFQLFTLPFLQIGEILNVQGVVLQPTSSPCPALFTASFFIEGI